MAAGGCEIVEGGWATGLVGCGMTLGGGMMGSRSSHMGQGGWKMGPGNWKALTVAAKWFWEVGDMAS